MLPSPTGLIGTFDTEAASLSFVDPFVIQSPYLLTEPSALEFALSKRPEVLHLSLLKYPSASPLSCLCV